VSGESNKASSETESDIEREARQGRQFTMQEALARMAGPGAMKGASPVSRQKQAEIEIDTWLRAHVTAPAGALRLVLRRHLAGSAALLQDVEHPLAVLESFFRRILESEPLLNEIVRESDFEWGRQMDERPHFNAPNSPPHADDPYTADSVRAALSKAIGELAES
jgi:hypothetical protein